MARSPAALALLALCAALSAMACSKEPECEGAACSDAGPSSPTGDNGGSSGGVSEEEACAMQVARAERKPSKPLDVIFVIDNSASMEDEIIAVRNNINASFAALIEQSGADFRVIMLSQFGVGGTDVCIEPPLAGAACSESRPLATDGARFFHYDTVIDSLNSLCKVLETFDQPDAFGRSPNGWQEHLRPDAHKAFVVITDDSASCTFEDDEVSVDFGDPSSDPFADALMFHSALLAKAPEQFGVPPEVRYQFYSFVGLHESEPANAPYFPHEDLVLERCDTAASQGLGYQALSVITDSLRYPVCEGRGFDSVFRVLAQNVVESVKADCTFAFPEPPPQQFIDVSSISLRYESEGQEPVQLEQVASSQACNAHAFYIRDRELELCAETCNLVQADPTAEVEVLYGCLAVVE